MYLVSKAEIGRRAGVTRQAVGDAVAQGVLRQVGEGRSAKIDVHDSKTNDYILNTNAQRKSVESEEPASPEIKESSLPAGSEPVKQLKMPKPPPDGYVKPRQLPNIDHLSPTQMRELSKGELKNLESTRMFKGKDGYYRYTYGVFNSRQEANQAIPILRNKGFSQAFPKLIGNLKKL